MKYTKYEFGVKLENRSWPSKEITKAPIWCSVGLRDGNQSLPVPMKVEEKLEYFNLVKSLGFKEIEVSFPSASDTDFNLVRTLIEEGYIEDDMVIQVLVQSKVNLIKRTFEAVEGAKKAIVHLYNSTSEQQRRIVFKMEKKDIIELALKGVKTIKELAKQTDTKIQLEYSPESFTGTEMDFALEICNAVINEWGPTKDNKIIINLPATVEMTTPNVFADSVEYFCNKVNNRENVIISIHAHNDRGTAVAASELAILAGADRIEGTLFGNGERTGNADIITMALNMVSRGIDSNLKINKINHLMKIYSKTTKLPIHPRHPYAGELVFTAFSGSHQDAIRKGMIVQKNKKDNKWDVPYLPIDPADIGREYEAIIRINSQSGKGGVAYILETEYGYHLPKKMHPEFGAIINNESDKLGIELTNKQIFDLFEDEYLENNNNYILDNYSLKSDADVNIIVNLHVDGKLVKIKGKGNGPISAFVDALKSHNITDSTLSSYEEHALSGGSKAKAAAYVQLVKDGQGYFGVGVDESTTKASFKAILSALNRMKKD